MVNTLVNFSNIHISATTNGHDGPDSKGSNHRVENEARAIDISRIDNKTIESLGSSHPWVIDFQTVIDELLNIRENFGLYWLHKEKKLHSPKPVRKKQSRK